MLCPYKNLLTKKYKNDKISKEKVLPCDNGSPWYSVAIRKATYSLAGRLLF